jgi:hypothetical protein
MIYTGDDITDLAMDRYRYRFYHTRGNNVRDFDCVWCEAHCWYRWLQKQCVCPQDYDQKCDELIDHIEQEFSDREELSDDR